MAIFQKNRRYFLLILPYLVWIWITIYFFELYANQTAPDGAIDGTNFTKGIKSIVVGLFITPIVSILLARIKENGILVFLFFLDISVAGYLAWLSMSYSLSHFSF